MRTNIPVMDDALHENLFDRRCPVCPPYVPRNFSTYFEPYLRTLADSVGAYQTFPDVKRTYDKLAPWCRVRACIVDNNVYVHTGSIFQERHASFVLGLLALTDSNIVQNVCVIHSCQDIPPSQPRTLSYTTYHGEKGKGVPWPDYLFWGRDTSLHKNIGKWEDALQTVHPTRKTRQVIYPNSRVVKDGFWPLRNVFTTKCINTMSPFWYDLHADIPSRTMRSLSPFSQFQYKCQYNTILDTRTIRMAGSFQDRSPLRLHDCAAHGPSGTDAQSRHVLLPCDPRGTSLR